MSELYKKLTACNNAQEFTQASNEIQNALNADPAGMLPRLQAAYTEAKEAETAAFLAYKRALAELTDTLEAKARGWDTFWAYSNASSCFQALYNHFTDAAYQVAYPEEVERLKDEPVSVTDRQPWTQ